MTRLHRHNSASSLTVTHRVRPAMVSALDLRDSAGKQTARQLSGMTGAFSSAMYPPRRSYRVLGTLTMVQFAHLTIANVSLMTAPQPEKRKVGG